MDLLLRGTWRARDRNRIKVSTIATVRKGLVKAYERVEVVVRFHFWRDYAD